MTGFFEAKAKPIFVPEESSRSWTVVEDPIPGKKYSLS